MQDENISFSKSDVQQSLCNLKDLVDSISAMNRLKIIFHKSSYHDEELSIHLEKIINEKINKLQNDFSDFCFAAGINFSEN